MGHFRKHCMSFLMSSTCNLDCTYCYIPHWGETVEPCDRTIDLEFAVAGMKEFFSWAPEPAIRFFAAGEPTVGFKRMTEIVEEGKKLVGDRLQVELQTNGYFNTAIADWVSDNVDILWISCDGPPKYQDAQRPSVNGTRRSSPLVEANIQRFATHPTMQVGARATFLQENFDKQIEVLDYFRFLGLKYVCGAPAYSSTVNDHTPVPMLVRFAQEFVPAFYHAQKNGQFYQTHLMVNFDEEVDCYCRACTTPVCPQLTSDGYVSCCDWACFGGKYLTGVLQDLIYGKWDKGTKQIVYFPEKKKAIEDRNVEHLAQGDCKGCPVIRHCAGGCIGKVMVRSGGLHKMDPNWCQATRYLAEHIPQNTGIYPVRHS
jgi:radical SAM protein with 4Fe4S-binding SPASM domain